MQRPWGAWLRGGSERRHGAGGAGACTVDGGWSFQGRWGARDGSPRPAASAPVLGPCRDTLSSCPGPSPCLNPEAEPWGQAERLWQALRTAGPSHSLCPSSGLGNEATSAPSPQRASGGRRAPGGKLWETAGSPGALMGSSRLFAPDKDFMFPLSSPGEQGQSPSARGGGKGVQGGPVPLQAGSPEDMSPEFSRFETPDRKAGCFP